MHLVCAYLNSSFNVAFIDLILEGLMRGIGIGVTVALLKSRVHLTVSSSLYFRYNRHVSYRALRIQSIDWVYDQLATLSSDEIFLAPCQRNFSLPFQQK